MTLHVPLPLIPPALPASAYVEAEHAIMTDEGLLIITAVLGTTIDWHLLAVVDPENDAVLSLAMHALDHGHSNEPYRTNATIARVPYVYNPAEKVGFLASEPLAYEAAVQVFPHLNAEDCTSTSEVRHG
jgi:hypothetical protein